MGSDWAPAVFLSILALTTGGVILLRPLVGRLADYLEVLIREKRDLLDGRPDIESLGRRLQQIEERLEFVDQLTRPSVGRQLPPDATAQTPPTEPG